MILALCLCCDHVGRMDGIQYGQADGLRRYLSMTEEQQAHVRGLIKKWDQKG